ncbi:hypothetical protein DNTS_004944, partial [Danionella cerebrum]
DYDTFFDAKEDNSVYEFLGLTPPAGFKRKVAEEDEPEGEGDKDEEELRELEEEEEQGSELEVSIHFPGSIKIITFTPKLTDALKSIHLGLQHHIQPVLHLSTATPE